MKPWIVLTLAATLTFACGEDDIVGPENGNGVEPTPIAAESVGEYLSDLPTWDVFSPLLTSVQPTPTGPTDTLPQQVVATDSVADDGSIVQLPAVTYACTETPYTLTDTPRQIVMYSPDVEVLWPGGLIQGKSYRDGGLGSLLGLPLAERTPIRVSIPAFTMENNFREVSEPNQAVVSQAIGSIVGAATDQGVVAPSTITFTQKTFYSEQEWALSASMSGKFLGFNASATGDVARNTSETTVTAEFFQKMFEVVVEPPQTPHAFFSVDFTQEKLQEQIDLGWIGPDNIPVYISNIVYGRMMMFSFTSTASESEIRATLSAVASAFFGGVSASASLSSKQKTILEQARIAVTSLGGNAQATINMIRTGNLADFFAANPPLSSATPLSYTFRNLSDGSIAKVSETTEYTIRECDAIPANPGLFSFLPKQTNSAPISTPYETLTGDVNGDGIMDMIWNHHVSGSGNVTYVGFGDPSGTLSFSTLDAHPETDFWTAYQPRVGDLNGDGMDDLMWILLRGTGHLYVGLSNGDGTFTYLPKVVQIAGTSGWWDYQPFIADIHGDGIDDVLLVHPVDGGRTYVGASDSAGTLTWTTPGQLFPSNSTRPFSVLVADNNGDAKADIFFNWTGSFNETRIVLGQSFSFRSGALTHPSGSGWNLYTEHSGDVNGDGFADMIWTSAVGRARVYVMLATAYSGGYLDTDSRNNEPQDGATAGDEGPFFTYVGDVDGDGDSDLIWNKRGVNAGENRIYVSLGTNHPAGAFDLSTQSQLHPQAENWTQYGAYIIDVTGDGKDDIVWNHVGVTNTVYVATSN